MRRDYFDFKQFSVANKLSAMPISTDSVLIGAWCSVEGSGRAVDVGTGTGVIALMLAQRNPELTIDAVDIDQNSVIEASGNFDRSPWSNRLNVKLADFNEWQGKYDLIVTNPPYFIDGIYSSNESRAQARHTQTLTYQQLIEHGSDLLNDSGRLAFITPYDLRAKVVELVTFSRLNISRICEVTSVEGKPPKRIMWELTVVKSPLVREKLVLRDVNGNVTNVYRSLCYDFYLSF